VKFFKGSFVTGNDKLIVIRVLKNSTENKRHPQNLKQTAFLVVHCYDDFDIPQVYPEN
jgi:hypothetical protein